MTSAIFFPAFAMAIAWTGLTVSAPANATNSAQRIAAAQTAATSSASCMAISDGSTGNTGFYWEIGDQNGIVSDTQSGLLAAGSVSSAGAATATFQRSTQMPIASASKWLYGAFVAETKATQQGGVWQLAAAYVPFLNFTSGYADMQDACSAAATQIANPTVQDCLHQTGTLPGTTNQTRVPPLVGHFYYNSGHFEVFHAGADATIAGVMNGANDTVGALASRVTTAFLGKNVVMNLLYFTPILAGGAYTTPADYAAFLQGMIRPNNPLVMGALLQPSATDPYAVCTNSADPACTTAKYSPLQGLESFHYSIGHWIEDDPQDGDGSYSSAGAYGFYPWIDASKTHYGIVARSDTSHASTDNKPGYDSWQCGRAIRAAFTSGLVATPSATTLTSSFNPSLSNQATTLTATVSGNSPTGNVTFSDGDTMLCSLVALQNVGPVMQAACNVSLGSTQTITAKYSGDANNAPSTSAGLTQTVSAAAAFNPDQFGLSGAWYNPATSGQGLLFEVFPDLVSPGVGQLFGGFFTYSADGLGERIWYSLQGDVQSNGATAQIGLYAPAAAGNFNAGPVIASKQVGTATITFGDCSHMTIAYRFSDAGGRAGTIPLTRLTINDSCSANGASAPLGDQRTLLSGAWYDTATSGQGMMFDISPGQNVLSAAWYTYAAGAATSGNPLGQTWYTLQSNLFSAGLTALQNVPIYTASGGVFDNPAPVLSARVGSANIAFAADCHSMTLEYTFTDGDNAGQTGSVTMQSLALPALPCSLATERVAPTYVVHDIVPATIDPAAVTSSDTSEDYHVAIPPVDNVAPTNQLFVFLPGTGGVPNQYELILRAGARRGFHTIGLDYPNSSAVGQLCLTSSDANCFWNVRREILTGIPGLSVDISVTPANAVITRLTEAVAYLARTYPSEGWERFLLTDDTLDWSVIIAGGHSQGGGHAGVLSKLYTLHRACYFASPPDWNLAGSPTPDTPAAWESYPNRTPAAVQFGFGGLQDPSVPWDQLSLIWPKLGLATFGEPVSVDTTAPPYNGSHMLTTDAQPNPSNALGTPLHGLTVRDAFTPLDTNGEPLFDPAWAYLCFQ